MVSITTTLQCVVVRKERKCIKLVNHAVLVLKSQQHPQKTPMNKRSPVTIKLTHKQFISLLKLVYLGNWIVNAIRTTDEHIEKFHNLEQFIFSLAKDAGLEDYVEFDSRFKEFFPKNKLAESKEMLTLIDEYDDETFWSELEVHLSRRDFIRAYGLEVIKRMSLHERIEKEQPFIDKYTEELEENGVENLEVIKPTDTQKYQPN